MFLLKIFYFLKGYVIISISDGKGAELLNLSSEYGLHIRNVTAGCAYIQKSELERLLLLAKSNGIVAEKVGEVSFYSKYLKNCGWFLFLGMFVVTVLFILSSAYVWEIEINGCNDDTASEITAILEEQGLRVGVLKSSLPSGNQLRDSIIYNVDGVTWAWVYLDGTLARVEVSQAEPPPFIDDSDAPCNITAAADGIIISVSAKNGRALLGKGDKVSKGDIIISGAMPGGTLFPPYAIKAEGDVYAETVRTESCIVPLYKTYTEDTGDSRTIYSIRLFSLEIPLGSLRHIPFEEYRTEPDIKPLGVCKYRYIETASITEQIPTELASDEAREAMYEKIAKSLAPGSSKTDERLVVRQLTEDSIKVTLSMTFRENIGVRTPVELWQTEELKNDQTD